MSSVPRLDSEEQKEGQRYEVLTDRRCGSRCSRAAAEADARRTTSADERTAQRSAVVRTASSGLDARTIETTNASRHQAVTSSTAAQVMVDGADLGPEEPALGQDTGKHRERRDAHGDAHEEHERGERHLAGDVTAGRARAPSSARARRAR